MKIILPELERLLDTLCKEFDSKHAQIVERRHMASLNWEEVDHPPVLVSAPLPADVRFKPFPHHEIYEDAEKMLYNELVHAFDLSIVESGRIRHDLPWTVRANFGTVLLASMFGAHVEQVGENPPWVRHDSGHDLSVQAILDADPDELLRSGWLPRVAERMEIFQQLLGTRPELAAAIRITLPDLQGPFDNFEHLRGNDAFYDLIDDPDETGEALRKVGEVQVLAARRLLPLTSDGPEGYCHQHGFMLRGHILLRCDSAIMVSPATYREVIAPHDNWVMEQLGGGAIHSCGNIGHLVEAYLELPALRSLDLGQSEMNDRTRLYEMAKERKVALIRVHAEREELESGRFAETFPTGIAVIHRAASFDAAQSLHLPAYSSGSLL